MTLAVEKTPVNGLEEPTEDEGLMYAIVCHQPGQCAEVSANEPQLNWYSRKFSPDRLSSIVITVQGSIMEGVSWNPYVCVLRQFL